MAKDEKVLNSEELSNKLAPIVQNKSTITIKLKRDTFYKWKMYNKWTLLEIDQSEKKDFVWLVDCSNDICEFCK